MFSRDESIAFLTYCFDKLYWRETTGKIRYVVSTTVTPTITDGSWRVFDYWDIQSVEARSSRSV